MSALPNTPQTHTKEAVAQALANAHRAADPAITSIYRLIAPGGPEANPAEPVKLLEINPHTSASGIQPVALGPHAPSGIFYSSIIIEIHPSEWNDLQSGKLQLPRGWQVAEPL